MIFMCLLIDQWFWRQLIKKELECVEGPKNLLQSNNWLTMLVNWQGKMSCQWLKLALSQQEIQVHLESLGGVYLFFLDRRNDKPLKTNLQKVEGSKFEPR
jgi:hypothetical protein